MRSAALVLLLLGGCELLANIPSYTVDRDDAAPAEDAAGDGGADGMMAECQTTPDCTAPEVCVMGQCGPCDEDAHCGPADANVCLPDGTCADAARIVYAAPAGTGTPCSLATPCSLDQAVATAAGSAALDVVKLAPGSYARDAVLMIADTVILGGQGATLAASTSTQLLRIETGSLTVIGATLVGNQSFNAICFDLANGTARMHLHRVMSRDGAYGAAAFRCGLTITRSAIYTNTSLGLYVQQGTIRIANTVVVGNTGAGGVQLVNAPDTRIALSTIAGNTSTSLDNASGITCGQSAGATLTSNIVWGNAGPTAIEASCVLDHSIVEVGYGGGTNNLAQDPLFTAIGDVHLQATSPARGIADPALADAIDVDGQPRPQGGGAYDAGADEIP